MSDELSDDQVYELLHAVLLQLSNRRVSSTLAFDVLAIATKNIELLQRAMIIMRETPPGSE